MNMNRLKISVAVGALAMMVGSSVAQDATTDPPQLAYGVSQVVQLSKANISEDTIVSFVQNSGNSYNLDANQIIYLKGQGVSANVINAMIGQRNRPVASVPAPQPDNTVATTTPAPAVPTTTSYVPSSTVYVIPDTQTYYYDANYAPYYSGYYGWPAVSIGFGWGGGWGGYHHGWGDHDGWRGGGGWHGGGGGGWRGGGGGFHGGGGWHH
jgi:hypothetical protein